MLGSLVARYSPDELELYLLDFKEGVSFAQFTPGRKDPSWLPHARLVGVNVNADREFGVAMLRFLADEMRRRADAAKQHEVTKLEELRAEDPDGRWPRIVAVIDEFQYLFAERDAVADEAVAAAGGRRAARPVAGHPPGAGQPGRVRHRGVLGQAGHLRAVHPAGRAAQGAPGAGRDSNEAAVELPRWHAIVNHESGVKQGNQIARIPDATSRGTFDALQTRLCEMTLAGPARADACSTAAACRVLADTAGFPGAGTDSGAPVAVGTGHRRGRQRGPVSLARAPGRNLAVFGSVLKDAASVLAAAALSVARQHVPGRRGSRCAR